MRVVQSYEFHLPLLQPSLLCRMSCPLAKYKGQITTLLVLLTAHRPMAFPARG